MASSSLPSEILEPPTPTPEMVQPSPVQEALPEPPPEEAPQGEAPLQEGPLEEEPLEENLVKVKTNAPTPRGDGQTNWAFLLECGCTVYAEVPTGRKPPRLLPCPQGHCPGRGKTPSSILLRIRSDIPSSREEPHPHQEGTPNLEPHSCYQESPTQGEGRVRTKARRATGEGQVDSAQVVQAERRWRRALPGRVHTMKALLESASGEDIPTPPVEGDEDVGEDAEVDEVLTELLPAGIIV